MISTKKKVKDLCDEMYKLNCHQIVIDLVQEIEQQLIHPDEEVSRDKVGSFAYEVDILNEAFNPEFEKDRDLLRRLYEALHAWQKDIEGTNIALGIPRES